MKTECLLQEMQFWMQFIEIQQATQPDFDLYSFYRSFKPATVRIFYINAFQASGCFVSCSIKRLYLWHCSQLIFLMVIIRIFASTVVLRVLVPVDIPSPPFKN